MLDKGHSIALVWRERKNTRDYLRHRPVVSNRHSTNATPMGAGARSCWENGTTGVLLHRHRLDPAEVISNFAKRWEMEVTFQEVRTHLGVETQRQWSKNAIARTTPALLGLYSLVCLWGQQALEANRMSYAAAWYEKTNFTFSDAIAVVRCEIFFCHTPRLTESVTKINLAYSNDCYTRFASLHNVQSRGKHMASKPTLTKA